MPKVNKTISNIEGINQALHYSMKKDKHVITYGLGATDPGKIFNTNRDLLEKFGPKSVFDTPTSENSLTGIGLGISLGGFIPIITHQRLDFFLLAMDQLVNNLAKWKFMFASKKKSTVIIRLIVGRGWGQGPTHSQSLHSWFSHIPGIKVLTPAFSKDYVGLLNQSLKENGLLLISESSRILVPFKKPIYNFFVQKHETQNTHPWYFSFNSLSNLLEISGFRIIKNNRYYDENDLVIIAKKMDKKYHRPIIKKDNLNDVLKFFKEWERISQLLKNIS